MGASGLRGADTLWATTSFSQSSTRDVRFITQQKYRMLFSPNHNRKPGPKGPSAELVHAVVEMKQRSSRWGCSRIAEQISLAFSLPIDKDVVRRILAHHHWPGRDASGPSWLTFLGHTKDSLWRMGFVAMLHSNHVVEDSWTADNRIHQVTLISRGI
jgi:hypothetical protein